MIRARELEGPSGRHRLPAGARRLATRRLRLSVEAALLLALSAGCANESLLGVETLDAAYWKGYYPDARDALARPRQWEKRDWLTFTGLLAGTAAVHSGDEWIRREILEAQNAGTDDLASYGEKLGAIEYLIPGLLVGHGLGWAFDDAKLKEATLLGTEGVVLSALAARVLKHAFGRERPFLGTGPDEFNGPTIHEDWDSWPSGHTTVAFAAATAFHLEYRKTWVSVLAYSLAALSGLSRMHDDRHWASDVFAGAAIGIVTTRAVFRARKERGR
jgi:membrane-associated phospholipid phosphatase